MPGVYARRHPRPLTVDTIADAAARSLTDPDYRNAAARIAAELTTTDILPRIEQLAGVI